MTDREKLVGLIRNCYVSIPPRTYRATTDDTAAVVIADHLLAHGVTVREPGYDTGKCRWFECSLCGYGVEDLFRKNEEDYPADYNFCPNCGARMEGKR